MLQQKSDQAAAIYSKCTALSDRLLKTTTKPSYTQGVAGAGWCVAWLLEATGEGGGEISLAVLGAWLHPPLPVH